MRPSHPSNLDACRPEVRRGVRAARRPRRGFTLTELLIVVAIIAVLASLITAAAINAMRNARRARILLEMRTMAQALENLKNEVGAFPPNVFPIGDPPPELDLAKATDKNRNDLKIYLSKVSNRSTELQVGGSGNFDDGFHNVGIISEYGLSPAEALVFWLQGFSSDEQRPLSGNDLVMTEVEDDEGELLDETVVTIDSSNPHFEFDRGRLRISRDQDDEPRILTLYRPGPGSSDEREVRILLYEYLAAGSEKPYVYFDTSRYSPYQQVSGLSLEFYMSDDTGKIVPVKRLKRNAPQATTDARKMEYVDQGKFQIIHPGLDDAWGDFEPFQYMEDELPEIPPELLLYPEGPFVGDVADTLTSFADSPLADMQENK